MNVKIIEVKSGTEVDAKIKTGTAREMPSLHEGWRFNFNKELFKLKNATGYLLVTEGPPEVIEGCMIFQLLDKREPYLAMIETAPHNKNDERKHDRVAGCLIAYAYKQSVIQGIDAYNAYLQLQVLEEEEENERKLMEVYSTKYNAKHIPGTKTMVIVDKDGEDLVDKYLPQIAST